MDVGDLFLAAWGCLFIVLIVWGLISNSNRAPHGRCPRCNEPLVRESEFITYDDRPYGVRYRHCRRCGWRTPKVSNPYSAVEE